MQENTHRQVRSFVALHPQVYLTRGVPDRHLRGRGRKV